MKKILVVVAMALIAAVLLSACQGGGEPATQNLSIRMGEGEIIQEVNGTDVLNGEFHRWEPSVLVVNKGDKVVLTVENPRSKYHSFSLPDFGVVMPRLEPRGGTTTVEFIADKAGVFQFACAVPFNREGGAKDCDLDHKRQVGYLIVLER